MWIQMREPQTDDDTPTWIIHMLRGPRPPSPSRVGQLRAAFMAAIRFGILKSVAINRTGLLHALLPIFHRFFSVPLLPLSKCGSLSGQLFQLFAYGSNSRLGASCIEASRAKSWSSLPIHSFILTSFGFPPFSLVFFFTTIPFPRFIHAFEQKVNISYLHIFTVLKSFVAAHQRICTQIWRYPDTDTQIQMHNAYGNWVLRHLTQSFHLANVRTWPKAHEQCQTMIVLAVFNYRLSRNPKWG